MKDDLATTVRFSTAPPDVTAGGLRRRMGEALSAAIMPFIGRAARPFIGGETIDDALEVAARLNGVGCLTAFSYWDRGTESLAEMEAISLAAMSSIPPGSYLSLKPPALRYSVQSARTLAAAAAIHNLRLHFDSHGTDVADVQNAMIETMLEVLSPAQIGTTLPGRQRRSLCDADWANQKQLNVRVVKGAWPDPADPARDLKTGFLEVIDRLAGKARHVAVATHDVALGSEAISRLRAAGTSCEIEVLLGMPVRALSRWAQDNAVPMRVYIPYGRGFIANAVGVLRRNPRLALAIAMAQITQVASRR